MYILWCDFYNQQDVSLPLIVYTSSPLSLNAISSSFQCMISVVLITEELLTQTAKCNSKFMVSLVLWMLHQETTL